jgi:hypothetical protein
MSQLEFQIINFENKYAILDHPIYKNLKWPIKELPADIEIGSFITLGSTIQPLNFQSDQNPDTLKKLLEDLIN